MDNIKSILEILKNLIPANTTETMNCDGICMNVSNADDIIKINIVIDNNTFDDSAIKEKVNKYRDLINNLDDCMFVAICEELEDDIDLNEFDSLLEQDSFTLSEAEIVESWIDKAIKVTKSHIDTRIVELELLKNGLE